MSKDTVAPIAPFENPVEAACSDCGQPVVRLYLWAHRGKPEPELDHCPKGPPIEGWDNFCTVIKRETDGATLHGESQLPGVTSRWENALEEFVEWADTKFPQTAPDQWILLRAAWMASRGIDDSLYEKAGTRSEPIQ